MLLRRRSKSYLLNIRKQNTQKMRIKVDATLQLVF